MPPLIKFEFSVPNSNRVALEFAGLAKAVQDWRKYIWPGVVRDAIRPWLAKQFRTQGAAGAHGKWAALDPIYAAAKQRRWGKKPILEASGAMKNDLLSPSNTGKMTERTLLYGTQVRYAIFHQKGTKKMAARRIFDPEASDGPGTLKRMIRVSVARSVANYARRRGFAIAGEQGLDVSAAEAGLLGRRAMSEAL